MVEAHRVHELNKEDGKRNSVTDLASLAKEPGYTEDLQDQRKLYRPHLTVCCGASVTRAMGFTPTERTARGVRYARMEPHVIAIDFAHPEARVAPPFLHSALVDAVAELLPTLRGSADH